jgi:hypothetical protein
MNQVTEFDSSTQVRESFLLESYAPTYVDLQHYMATMLEAMQKLGEESIWEATGIQEEHQRLESSTRERHPARTYYEEPVPEPPSMLSRILARQPEIRHRAMEVRQKYGDPIQSLAELLGNMPGSQEEWDALIDEPY